MENRSTKLPKVMDNTTELFRLLHFIQELDTNVTLEKLSKTGYPSGDGLSTTGDVCFFRIKKLSYDEEYPRREAFENVLNMIDNDAYNFVYILSGTPEGVELLIGVVKNHRKNRKTLSTVNYGEIIENAFEGNFNGSTLVKMNAEELKNRLFLQSKQYKSAGVISGIPSINAAESGNSHDFQGIDRLINSMHGQNWRIIVVCEPVSRKEILKQRDDVYELYNRLSVYSKMSVQSSSNSGDSLSFGRNVSDSHGKNQNWNESDTETRGSGNSDGTRNRSSSHQTGKSGGINDDHSEGQNWSYSRSSGNSEAVTMEVANKHAQDLMKYIDEELLPRIKEGYAKGMYKTSLFYMADKVTAANRLRLSVMSLFQGNQSTFGPLIAQELNLKDPSGLHALQSYQNLYYSNQDYSLDGAALLSRPVDSEFGLGASAYLTAGEVSILAGLPQREVPGIVLDESVDFGLNEHYIEPENAVDLGVIVQKGRKLNNRFLLRKDTMSKHIFIAGVTGTGKTTTCQKLLSAAKVPFLVIEPAKTEYRILAQERNFGQVYIFTLGNESVAPFRLNPFELVEGEVISAHIDMLKATFTSAFPMEASMPQILEEAIVRCYEEKGWDLRTNKNDRYPFAFGDNSKKGKNNDYDRDKCFPVMSDLLREMKEIVKEKGFGDQMKADYEGSLVSRLSNLTVGVKGKMLNCPYSTDFSFLIKNKVIIEMEELKSPEDKALFMGFILSRLYAVIKKESKNAPGFQHLTLIEEAHRLLSKPDYGDRGAKKAAVDTFTDMLAEVRKYGEGLIVVDQIPNKLAPEVLKNTNTKIIHKILARDDKETVGDTMLMNDKQKEYLAALETGHVIAFTEDTDKPVHVYVERTTDTSKTELTDEEIHGYFQEWSEDFGEIYKYREIYDYNELFQKACRQIHDREIDIKFHEEFKRSIEKLSERTELSQKDILKKYHIWKTRLKRKDIDEDAINQNIDFLSEIFSITRDTYKDLPHKKCSDVYTV